MNFKRLTFLAIFTATQIAMLTPVSADNVVPEEQNGIVTESVYELENNGIDPVIIDPTMVDPVIVDPANIDPVIINPVMIDPPQVTDEIQNPSAKSNELILMINSAEIYQDGKMYTASQPMMAKDGVSYVAIRSLVDRVGLKLTYVSKTKETVIISGDNELRFKLDSNKYSVNGVMKEMKGATFQKDNVFMVPLTSITQALNIPYIYDSVQKRVVLTLSTKPVASFVVQQKEVIAGETTVTYVTNASSPSGLPIVEERWEGREDIFQGVGSYEVSYSVLDSNGEWSDPYTLIIEVKAPNLPPVAMFLTDKLEYKMGEPIAIQDQSTDDENNIVKREWVNNKLAFFRPGIVTIQLKVTDGHGAVGTYETTITIKEETLYIEADFNKLFKPVGSQYRFDGFEIPSMKQVAYTTTSEPVTLIRSNSPETVYSEGVVYRETTVGLSRFMIHHVNAMSKNVRMYVIATNKNEVAATVNVLDSGFAGPNIYATLVGKLSVQRYYESIQRGLVEQSVSLEPGESKIIFNELNKLKMSPNQVISLLADVNSNYAVEYTVIMIDAEKDALVSLPYLMDIARDGVHNRGTYPNATRYIEYNEVVGVTPERISLGDNKGDPNLIGWDALTGLPESNLGNFGVMYKITLNRVAANTLITFNPRGGQYSGMIMVNGQIINVPEGNGMEGSLLTANDTSVVHRTGNNEEKVEILFTPAPGSNLPVNLLFSQMPERKQ